MFCFGGKLVIFLGNNSLVRFKLLNIVGKCLFGFQSICYVVWIYLCIFYFGWFEAWAVGYVHVQFTKSLIHFFGYVSNVYNLGVSLRLVFIDSFTQK